MSLFPALSSAWATGLKGKLFVVEPANFSSPWKYKIAIYLFAIMTF